VLLDNEARIAHNSIHGQQTRSHRTGGTGIPGRSNSMSYILDTHTAYWAKIIQQDMAKRATPQKACNDVARCILLMGRGIDEALRVTQAAAYFAGIPKDAVKW
jgi:hypothetical protein